MLAPNAKTVAVILAATLVIFVALIEDVATTVRHAVIMQVKEDTTAAVTHKLFVVLAEWTGYVVDVVLDVTKPI